MYEAANAEKIVAALRETEAESEATRRLSDRAVELLHQSGVTRIVSPAAYGGYELPVRALVEAERIVAQGSTAASWVLMVCAAHTFIAGRMPRRGQDEYFGGDAGMLIPGVPSLRGTCRRTAGGYILKGRWPYASGADHGDWVLVGCRGIPNDAGETCPPLIVVMPKKDAVIDDTWFTLGMRGTGSKDIVVEDAFIPSYRALEYTKVAEGDAAKEAGLTETGYHVPFSCVFPLGITSAVIGICEGALAHHAAWQASRTTVSGAASKDDPYALYALSEAAADIAASRAALVDNVTRMHDAVSRGHVPTFAERAAGRRTQVQAAWRAVRALDEVVARSGGNAMRMDNPIQRFWRDAHTGLAHAIHVPGPTFHAAGLGDLGLEPPAGPLRSMI